MTDKEDMQWRLLLALVKPLLLKMLRNHNGDAKATADTIKRVLG